MLARLTQMPTIHEGQLQTALRLLLNLSFSPALQAQMVNSGLLPKLVSFATYLSHFGY